ncbi:MAG: hypothetical protein C0592_13940 [Marinilabiliales bacterium]|nr:MAG: hypothetical protein C0592_13940 [Marinilabiliales bacterium]
MKNIYPLIIFIIGVFVTFSVFGQQTALEKKVNNGHKPLFVTTAFVSDIKTISLSNLESKWNKGEVYYAAKNQSQVWQYFGSKNGIAIHNLDSFARYGYNKLLICGLENLQPQLLALSVDSINYFENPVDYPVYLSGYAQVPVPDDFTRITITGVTAITRGTGNVADAKGLDFLIAGVKDQFQYTDILHISNEVSFTNDCDYPAKTMLFCTKKEHFDVLNMLGVDIVELTGNHNRDYGDEAFDETYNWYWENGMQTFGGGRNPEEAAKPLVLTLNDGSTIAFVGFNELCPCGECSDKPGESGANRWNKEQAKSTIDSLRRAGVDFIIVSVQFGEVDSYEPTPSQKKITHFLVDAGADLVYGSQAHQIQQFEFYKGKPIMNGLGNFLFDQIHRIGVRQSCFVHLIFYKGKLIQMRPVFTQMGLDRQLRLATPSEEAEMRKVVVNY